eukprot:12822403-Alexandrium_andersonii.AAC.1
MNGSCSDVTGNVALSAESRHSGGQSQSQHHNTAQLNGPCSDVAGGRALPQHPRIEWLCSGCK